MTNDTLAGLIERLEKYEICGVGMTLEEGNAANNDLKMAVAILKEIRDDQGNGSYCAFDEFIQNNGKWREE